MCRSTVGLVITTRHVNVHKPRCHQVAARYVAAVRASVCVQQVAVRAGGHLELITADEWQRVTECFGAI